MEPFPNKRRPSGRPVLLTFAIRGPKSPASAFPSKYIKKFKKLKKKLKIKRIFKTHGEYIIKHKKFIIISEVHTMNFT